MRYQLVAKQAMQEGYKTLADEIRTIAKNETYHAKRFFETIQEKAGSTENIDIEAGYPFHAGSLAEGLAFAAADEKAETEIYPEFAETAKRKDSKTSRHYSVSQKKWKNRIALSSIILPTPLKRILFTSPNPPPCGSAATAATCMWAKRRGKSVRFANRNKATWICICPSRA